MRRGLGVVVLAAAIVACAVKAADAAKPPDHLAMEPAATCSADSLCYNVTWPNVSDAAGAADHYHVRITSSAGAVIDDTVATNSFRFAVLKPPPAQTVTLSASVWSLRRGKQSASAATASATYTQPDVAPPAPGSLTIQRDTTTQVAILGPDTIQRGQMASYEVTGVPDSVVDIEWWVEPGGGAVFASVTRTEFGERGEHGIATSWQSPGSTFQLILGMVPPRQPGPVYHDDGPWPRVSKTILVQ